MISRTTSSDTTDPTAQASADADHRAGQHHLQVPAVIVAPVPPERNDVLHEQDRQQDRERLQRRHREREQRRRRHADAGEAAFGEPDEQHGDQRGDEENRIGEQGGARARRDLADLEQGEGPLATLI